MASMDILASTITEQAAKLAALQQEAGLPLPSFETSGSQDFSQEVDTPVGKAIREARSHVLDAALDLVRLVRGPTEHILTLAWSAADTANLDVITRLQLPHFVPLGSSITLEHLSTATRVPQDYLARIVRYAIANGIFTEPEAGAISHSAASTALLQNPHLTNIVHFGTEFLGNVLLKTPDYVLAQRDHPATAPPTAFNIAYRTDKDLFHYFQQDAHLTKKYHEYLAGRVNTPMWSVDRLRAAWPWADQGAVTVVDIGGSSGHTVRSLVPLMPQATFIVQDSNPAALEMGRRAVATELPAAQSRVSFAEYDFFTPQPVHADIYIYRHILHDWSDADAVSILSSLLPALRPGARVLLSEGILPTPPAARLNTLADKMIRIEDAFMLAAHDAKERSVADFASLFERVKPGGFRLAGVTSGSEAGAFQSLLEFEFLG